MSGFWIGVGLIMLCIFWPFGRRASSNPADWPCTIRCVRKRKIGGRWVKLGEFTVSAENSRSAVALAAAQYKAMTEKGGQK